MAPKKTLKPMQETMVEKSTQDREVPPKAIREEEQENYEKQKTQKDHDDHGYTWEFFKERIESKFIPKNSDYISRCKLRDLVNATNDNLRQYVKVYSKFILEIQHMHELDCVCHFVMGLLTWAKHKLEKNWLASLSDAIMKVEGFSNVGWGEKVWFQER